MANTMQDDGQRTPDIPGDHGHDEHTEALLRETLEGDRSALDALLRRYEDRVLRIVRIRMSDRLRTRLESRDVLQEAMMAASKDITRHPFQEPADLIRWLAGIVENRIRSAAARMNVGERDPRYRHSVDDTAIRGHLSLADPSPSPSKALEDRERRASVDESVAKLASRWREVIVLRDYEGSSWRRVAKEIGTSVEAAQARHRRAREALASQLAADSEK